MRQIITTTAIITNNKLLSKIERGQRKGVMVSIHSRKCRRDHIFVFERITFTGVGGIGTGSVEY